MIIYTYSDYGENAYSYKYDSDGIRTSKTLMGVTTYFTTINGNITSQYTIDENGARTDEILFLYDDNNEILGAVLDNEYVFYYTKNAMGDVTGFADADGNRISEYYFNAWGEIIGGSRNIGSTLPYAEAALKFDSINPIRYKGYYYDDEFGMYYLQSRYYMPSWCRFINADLPEYAQMQKNENAGVNLFAYCCNDPVNNVDIRGTWAKAVHSGFKSKGNYYSVVSNGKRYYYGTYYWAIRCGFNYHCAEKLAKYCQDLDVYYSSTLYSKAIAMNGSGRGNNPIYSPQQLHNFQRWQYWHFNEYTSMGRDSRKEYAERRLKDAIYWWNKNYARSLMWLGYGLHAIQDVSAHGQIGAGAWIPQHIYLDSRNKTLFTSADSVQGFVWSNGKRNGLIYLKGSVVRLMEAQRDTYDYLNRFLRAIGKKR